MKPNCFLSIAACAVLAGCATVPGTGRAVGTIDITSYRAVNIAPVQFAPAALSALSAEERASLEREFRLALTEGIPPSLLKDEPSIGAVRIEVTVTELDASSPTVNLLTAALLFVPLDAGGVAFDARFYDGESREPFAHTSYRHISTPLELKGSFRRYGHAIRALRNWAEAISSCPKKQLLRQPESASATLSSGHGRVRASIAGGDFRGRRSAAAPHRFVGAQSVPLANA